MQLYILGKQTVDKFRKQLKTLDSSDSIRIRT